MTISINAMPPAASPTLLTNKYLLDYFHTTSLLSQLNPLHTQPAHSHDHSSTVVHQRCLVISASSKPLKPYSNTQTTITVTGSSPAIHLGDSAGFHYPSRSSARISVPACEELLLSGADLSRPQLVVTGGTARVRAAATLQAARWACIRIDGCVAERLVVASGLVESVVVRNSTVGRVEMGARGSTLALDACAVAELSILDCTDCEAKDSAFGDWYVAPTCWRRSFVMRGCQVGAPNRLSSNLEPSRSLVRPKTPLESAEEDIRPSFEGKHPVFGGARRGRAVSTGTMGDVQLAPGLPTFTLTDYSRIE